MIDSLICAWPSARHPDTARIETETLIWLDTLGLLTASERSAFQQARFTYLMGHAYPHADAALLRTIAKWNAWTFLVDNQLDHGALGRSPGDVATLGAAIAAVLAGRAPVQQSPLIAALVPIAADLATRGGATWMANFAHHVLGTMQACVTEAAGRATGTVPTLAVYETLRPQTSGTACFLDLCALVTPTLAAAVLQRPAMQALRDHAVAAVYLANDVVSFPKEQAAGDHHNMVLVLHHHQRLGLEVAVAHVTARHNAHAAAIVAAYETLTAPEERRYAARLAAWVRANLDWSRMSGRYQPQDRAVGVPLR